MAARACVVVRATVQDLDAVVAGLHTRGFYTGLWSSTGLPNITREVAGSGVRIGKTDVGWIGAGYKYAFESVQFLSDGIEKNSDGRRFICTPFVIYAALHVYVPATGLLLGWRVPENIE